MTTGVQPRAFGLLEVEALIYCSKLICAAATVTRLLRRARSQ
jgi:hypothetical protein